MAADMVGLRGVEADNYHKSGAEDRAHPEISRRIHARKALVLHPIDDPKKLVDPIVKLALAYEGARRAVLVFARTVEAVEGIAAKLPKERVKTLTGTLRGL